MDRQESDVTTRAPRDTEEPANELDILEQLRQGHGLLSPTQFMEALRTGDMEVWSLPFSQFALITWGTSAEGKTANILTTVGSMAYAAAGLAAIEKLAIASGAKAIMSVGRVAWTKLVTDAGYDVTPAILMRKTLHAH